MQNYFSGVSSEPSIISREEALLPDYIPDNILHREAELQTIADAIKPLLRKGYSNNLFIHGTSGTGKTSSVKFLIKQLLEASSSVLPVYVNCWENNTQLAVYNCIIEKMRLPIPRRGLAADELFKKITSYMKGYEKPILLVLDEMDGLKADDLLYVISRANEKQGVIFGIIGITNNKELLASLDPRVRSSLRFSSIEFKQYTEEQLFSILRTRAEVALVPNSYDERVLRKIADAVDDGNARNALGLLWKAAKRAENKYQNKITLQDVVDSEAEQDFRFSVLNLSAEELKIINALKGGEKKSSELYNSLTELNKSKRQIRNYIDALEKKGVLESEELQSGGLLSTKIYRLKV